MNVFYFIFANVLSTVLKNAFDAFDQEKNGFIGVTMVGTILGMLGHQLDEKMLNEVVAEVDEDGSGTYYVDIHSCEQNMLSSKRMPEAPSLLIFFLLFIRSMILLQAKLNSKSFVPSQHGS